MASYLTIPLFLLFHPHMELMQMFMPKEKYMEEMNKYEDELQRVMKENGFGDILELFKAIALR